MMKWPVAMFSMFVMIASTAKSEPIVFDFSSSSGLNQAGLDLDALAAGSSMVTGSSFNVTFSAAANTGVFNYTSSPNFGINGAGAGDATDAFDGGTGLAEVMTFSFAVSTPATLTFSSIDFDRMSGAGLAGEDQGSLAFSGGSTIGFDGSTVDSDDLLTVGEIFSAGQSITLSHVDGNGFGLEQLTLEVTPDNSMPVVPEPTSGLIWIALAAGVIVLNRWIR